MAKQRRIKQIQFLSARTSVKDPLMWDILKSLWSKTNPKNLDFMFSSYTGDVFTRRIPTFKFNARRTSDETGMWPVKFIMDDGTVEYGFKEVSCTTVEKKPKLISLYVRSGLKAPNGEWMPPCSLLGKNAHPSPELMKKFSMYNHNDDCIGGRTLDSSRWECIKGWVEMCRDVIEVEDSPYAAKDLPPNYSKVRMSRPYIAYPPEGYEKWLSFPPVFFTMERTSYIKSTYRPNEVTRLRNCIYKASDLLMISLEKDDQDEPTILWDSLDSTVHGRSI